MPKNKEPNRSEAETHQRIKKMRENAAVQERSGDYWSEEDTQQLSALFCEGVGISEIAVLTQRTERAVYQKIHSMGLFEKIRCPKVPKESVDCLCAKCTRRSTCVNFQADAVCTR